MVRLGKVSIAVTRFGVCDFCHLAVTDWRLWRWRLWFLALMTVTRNATIPKCRSWWCCTLTKIALQTFFCGRCRSGWAHKEKCLKNEKTK